MTTNLNVTCILHIGDGCDIGDIKPINANTWSKIISASKRRSSQQNSKYFKLVESLPLEFLPIHGYHASCYSNFTAVPKEESHVKSTNKTLNVQTRSNINIPCTSKTPGVILPELCIFCDKKRKKLKDGKWESLGRLESKNAEVSLRDAAEKLNDDALLLKLGRYKFGEGQDLVAKEAQTHHSCRRDYLRKASRISSKGKHSKEETTLRNHCFDEIINHIKDSVIGMDKPEYASSLLERFRILFKRKGGASEDTECYTVQNFCKRIRSAFEVDILSIKCTPNNRTLLYNSTSSLESASNRVSLQNDEETTSIVNSANYLREQILKQQSTPLTAPVTVESILGGEVEPPDCVKLFYRHLYTGQGDASKVSESKQRYIDSSSADTVFACSGGRLLPGKHLSLGLAIKSLTGSRQLVTLANRFGHTAGNETIRPLDMELEQTCKQTSNLVPNGIIKHRGLSLGLAWDNFDLNIETLSGAGTVHHTYGICYQNIDENISQIIEDPVPESSSGERRKRRFSKVEATLAEELPPYFKKPRYSGFKRFLNRSFDGVASLTGGQELDILWVISFTVLSSLRIPMWSGWNSQKFIDSSPKQKVCYMDHIQFPPTSQSTVIETLRRSQQVAKECGEDYAIVTYDLGIAKPAKQIQSEESPEFDNVFIMLGSFHTEMAYFSALGRYIKGSGAPFALCEASVLATGSLNKFLKGKMYNRCRRNHTLLFAALHSLHLDRFFQDVEIDDVAMDILTEWTEDNDEHDVPVVLKELSMKYDVYCKETVSGVRGKTAQFWMTYCYLMELYLLFHRSVKENNIHLNAHAIHKMLALFFATNHQNYSRYLSLYSLELLNLEHSNPVVFRMLASGGFSVRRNDMQFNRVGVDMCLEQTINAQAKNRLKGVVAYADVNTAVNRWLVTSSMRTQLLNNVLNLAGMTFDYDEKPKELRESRITKDAADMTSLRTVIGSMMNPFDPTVPQDKLFNIKTGQAVCTEAEQYLLSVVSLGEGQRNLFINGCLESDERFEMAITRNKIFNFASATFKKKNKSKIAGKIVEKNGTRDLFGALLYLVAKQQINLEYALSYPLTPYPSCLSHPDGTMRKTDEAKMMGVIEKKVNSVPPSQIDNAVLDGMFILHTLPNRLPPTLRGLVEYIMIKIMKFGLNRVDICFDTYVSPSIKDPERSARGNEDISGSFKFGAGQKTPTNFRDLLKLSQFKAQFLSFFMKEIETETYSMIVKNKILYCAVDNKCKSYQSINGAWVVNDVNILNGNHEEADTRVAFHLKHINDYNHGNTIVRGTDTDLAIVMLANVQNYENIKLWFDVGIDSSNTRRYVDITKARNAIENCDALVALYTFTGCDYSPAFAKKGKIRPYELMLKHERFVDVFTKLGTLTSFSEMSLDMKDTIEEFTCLIYGQKNCMNIDEALYTKFCEKYKPRLHEEPFWAIKSIEPTLFPPCRRILIEHIKRSIYITKMYKSASFPDPSFGMDPIDYGWEMSSSGTLMVRWFEGEQVPREFEEQGDNINIESDDETVEEESEEEDNEDSEIWD